jgi:hypothetical protein
MRVINVRKDGTITNNLIVPKELMERVVANYLLNERKKVMPMQLYQHQIDRLEDTKDLNHVAYYWD